MRQGGAESTQAAAPKRSRDDDLSL
jgi:hypothetical protein